MTPKGKKGLSLKVKFDGSPKEKIGIAAYVFDSKGELIETAAVKNDRIDLKLSSVEDLRYSRMFIAPVSINEISEPREASLEIRDMLARNAYEPQINTIASGITELLPIPEFHWEYWCWIACRIRGRVVKPIQINNPGNEDMPVCRARVHICEVDAIRLILPIIPDDILVDLRDFIIDFPEPPIPNPTPPFIVREPSLLSELKTPRVEKLDNHVIKSFSVESPQLIREALINNFTILHPYLCLFPRFWPYFYRCDELRTVLTDSQGRFDTTIFYQCGSDKPDIYFWVEYFIGDTWTTVYRPSIPCHTYWNYLCGSDVTIRVTDPRVDVCGELPTAEGSDSVEIIKVGNGAFVSHIQQGFNQSTPIQGENLRTVGLTDIGFGSGNYKRPFGASLGLRIRFGSGFPQTGGITHFKWSYRKTNDANLNGNLGDWTAMNHPVHINYYEEVGFNSHKKPYPLGPDPSYAQTVYKIPPHRASNIDVPNPNGYTRNWALEEWNSAILNTLFSGISALQRKSDAGLYEFKFELMKKVGATMQVATVNKKTFQIPKFTDSNVSVDAPDINLILAPGNKASAFTMKIRIDNNKCQADILPVKVNNTPANDCGFVEYSDKAADIAQLSFKAYHPNNFANLRYKVRKATEKYPNVAPWFGAPRYRAQASGMVIGDIGNLPDGYIKNPVTSVFSKAINVNLLLGNCTDAAFGEHLYVDALATNGSTNELGYDASSLAGFALKKT